MLTDSTAQYRCTSSMKRVSRNDLQELEMSSVPAGQRRWKCPDCGGEVLLSITQLDPMACEACLQKLKRGHSGSSSESPNPISLLRVPSGLVPLLIVGFVMLAAGIVIGFVLGRATVPPAPAIRPARPEDTSHRATPDLAPSSASRDDQEPDEASRPGPGYKWVRGYTRKDGVAVKGHWARDHKSDADRSR